MPSSDPRPSIGRRGEQLAAEHLIRRGYQIVAANWRTRFGELDLVALDRDTVVFVEVRTRTSTTGGTAAESVDGAKQRQVRLMAEQYLQRHAPLAAARIDVVTVFLPASGQPRIVQIEGAI